MKVRMVALSWNIKGFHDMLQLTNICPMGSPYSRRWSTAKEEIEGWECVCMCALCVRQCALD